MENAMDTFKLKDTEIGEMHGGCEHCGAFVELYIKDGKTFGGEKR